MDIEQYLRREGVRSFEDPRSYWNWANRTLGTKLAKQFADSLKERSRGDRTHAGEFYDFVSRPEVSLAAASFEYGLLVQTARWVESCLPLQGTVVELGCHTGLLTRYYALKRPDAAFIGLERSEAAVKVAQATAQTQRITNLRFIAADLQDESTLPDIQADVIITGRVIGDLMDAILLRRLSWKDYQFPTMDASMDADAWSVVGSCMKMLSPHGKFLVTERATSFDRIRRLWLGFQAAGCYPYPSSLTPVGWNDVSGDHTTWFFQAGLTRAGITPELPVEKIPWLSKEIQAVGNPTRLMLDGILAWQTWKSFTDRTVRGEANFQWESEEQIHYEYGETGAGLGYAYIASNTDLHLLTLFLPQETDAVVRDLKEYAQKLKQSGSIST